MEINFNLCGVEELKKCNDRLNKLQDKIIMVCDGSFGLDDIEVKELGAIAEAKFIIDELAKNIKEAESNGKE